MDMSRVEPNENIQDIIIHFLFPLNVIFNSVLIKDSATSILYVVFRYTNGRLHSQ